MLGVKESLKDSNAYKALVVVYFIHFSLFKMTIWRRKSTQYELCCINVVTKSIRGLGGLNHTNPQAEACGRFFCTKLRTQS
jgi:hypothetical protein